MQWKHYRLSRKWVNSAEQCNALLPTPQTRLQERKREKKKKHLPPTNQHCLKIRVAEIRERVQMWRGDKKKPCKYWHCDSPSPVLIRRTFPVGAIKHLLGTVTGARGSRNAPLRFSFRCQVLRDRRLWGVCALFAQGRRRLEGHWSCPCMTGTSYIIHAVITKRRPNHRCVDIGPCQNLFKDTLCSCECLNKLNKLCFVFTTGQPE